MKPCSVDLDAAETGQILAEARERYRDWTEPQLLKAIGRATQASAEILLHFQEKRLDRDDLVEILAYRDSLLVIDGFNRALPLETRLEVGDDGRSRLYVLSDRMASVVKPGDGVTLTYDFDWAFLRLFGGGDGPFGQTNGRSKFVAGEFLAESMAWEDVRARYGRMSESGALYTVSLRADAEQRRLMNPKVAIVYKTETTPGRFKSSFASDNIFPGLKGGGLADLVIRSFELTRDSLEAARQKGQIAVHLSPPRTYLRFEQKLLGDAEAGPLLKGPNYSIVPQTIFEHNRNVVARFQNALAPATQDRLRRNPRLSALLYAGLLLHDIGKSITIGRDGNSKNQKQDSLPIFARELGAEGFDDAEVTLARLIFFESEYGSIYSAGPDATRARLDHLLGAEASVIEPIGRAAFLELSLAFFVADASSYPDIAAAGFSRVGNRIVLREYDRARAYRSILNDLGLDDARVLDWYFPALPTTDRSRLPAEVAGLRHAKLITWIPWSLGREFPHAAAWDEYRRKTHRGAPVVTVDLDAHPDADPRPAANSVLILISKDPARIQRVRARHLNLTTLAVFPRSALVHDGNTPWTEYFIFPEDEAFEAVRAELSRDDDPHSVSVR